jgi:hypothetical protein
LQVKNICDCIWSGNDINFTRRQVYAFIRTFFWFSRWTWDTKEPPLWSTFCFSPGFRICAMNSPTSSNMATYYKQFPSQLNVWWIFFYLQFLRQSVFFVFSINVFEYDYNNLKCSYPRQVASFSTCDIASRNVVSFFSNPFKSSEANKWIGAWTF